MPEAKPPPSFDDIAVALSLAAGQMKYDLEQVEYLAARIELSPMGTSLAVLEIKRNLDLVVHAHHFFKEGAPAEREVRAAVDRKKRGRWPFSLGKVAAL